MKMTTVEPKKVFLLAPLVWALFIFQQAESSSATIEDEAHGSPIVPKRF